MYEQVFRTMITDWHAHWGGQDLPFLYVQLANFNNIDNWPTVREAQRRRLSLCGTGMAVTMDIGESSKNYSTPNYLYQNMGLGKFREIALDAGVAVNADGKEQANMGVTVGDYLHTGRPFTVCHNLFRRGEISVPQRWKDAVQRSCWDFRACKRFAASAGLGHQLRRLRQRWMA